MGEGQLEGVLGTEESAPSQGQLALVARHKAPADGHLLGGEPPQHQQDDPGALSGVGLGGGAQPAQAGAEHGPQAPGVMVQAGHLSLLRAVDLGEQLLQQTTALALAAYQTVEAGEGGAAGAQAL